MNTIYRAIIAFLLWVILPLSVASFVFNIFIALVALVLIGFIALVIGLIFAFLFTVAWVILGREVKN